MQAGVAIMSDRAPILWDILPRPHLHPQSMLRQMPSDNLASRDIRLNKLFKQGNATANLRTPVCPGRDDAFSAKTASFIQGSAAAGARTVLSDEMSP